MIHCAAAMNGKCWGAVAVAGVLAVTGASSGAGGQAGRAAPTQQVLTPVEGDPPPFRFGYTPDWYANELRRDMEEAERLQKEGRSPLEIITATSFPSDGIEFAIRRPKFPGPRWRVRLGASVLAGGKPGWLVHPPDTTERTTDGWLVLRLD